LVKGYPVLICGTTDKHKQFHPFSLNICSHETEVDYEFMFATVKKSAKKFFNYDYRPDTLIADAAPAIHNGFMNAFDYKSLTDFNRVMCWSHVYRNCENMLKSISAEIKDSILDDIKSIQVKTSSKAFDVAIEKFFEKWEEEPSVKGFLEHFKKEWVDKNNGWYEGFCDGNIPSTDNGLESLNGKIKSKNTLRERMSVGQYLGNANAMVTDWSKDRGEGDKVEKFFYEKPFVPGKTWTMAYDFLYKGQGIIKKGKTVFVTALKEYQDKIIPIYINGKYDQIKSEFDTYIEYFRRVRIIKLDRENWAKSSCSCSWYLKNYSCYHLIAVATHEKLVEIPIEFKNVALEAKPAKGRKPKAKKALERNAI
jgi:hypothetical protein